MAKTTTLKLDDRLRKRIAPLASAVGQTPHAWMVSALEAQAELAEKRRTFLAAADASAAELERTGELYDADDVHAYFLAQAAGVRTRRPRPKKRIRRR
ncbi:MAG TPA: hypothetical protein VM513_14905 [Kofleriaceae bacterium]|jgi:predicted transcriptional regulator|nr:hypothetical protein [Kofleriaceae bacterium]